jgi:hypothetical protein
MANISRMPLPPSRGWGIVALIVAGIPLPLLFAINILSLVIRTSPTATLGSAETWIYGLLAAIGLLLFPLFFILGILFSILAITRIGRPSRVMGSIALAIILISVPFVWFGYLVWIFP